MKPINEKFITKRPKKIQLYKSSVFPDNFTSQVGKGTNPNGRNTEMVQILCCLTENCDALFSEIDPITPSPQEVA